MKNLLNKLSIINYAQAPRACWGRTLITLFCLFLASTSFAAVTNISSGGLFSTLDAAVSVAGKGDTLLVSTGIYYETVNIYNQNLIIDGKYNDDFSAKIPDGKTIISAPRATFIYSGSTFDITNSVVKFINIEITKGGFDAGKNGNGGGLNIRYDSDVQLHGCSVYTNFAKGNGGGIYLYNSVFWCTNTLIFGNNIYKSSLIIPGDNGCGGGIYGYESSVETLDKTKVFGNKASVRGGGIRLKNSDGNTRFAAIFYNYAGYGGGAVAAYNSTYSYNNASEMYSNIALTKGGGILLEKDSECSIFGFGASIGYPFIWGPNEVTNGNGGGVYVDDSTLILSNQALIAHNTASGYGGGIFLTNATFIAAKGAMIGNTDVAFTNKAVLGGSIYAISSTLNITNSIITSGVADTGAGLFLHDSYTIIEDSKIIGNKTDDGPGDKMGGGIFIFNSNTFYASNSLICDNNAGYGGGIVTYTASEHIQFDSCSIMSNNAEIGGGLLSVFDNSVIISGNSIINGNTAVSGGGVGVVSSSTVFFDADSPITISGNTATKFGGGIYCQEASAVNAEGSIRIYDNVALKNGGGIYLTNNCSLVLTNISYSVPKIYGNTAEENGGGIYLEGHNCVAKLTKVQVGLKYDGNISKSSSGGGGGIAIRDFARVDAVNCTIRDNSSEKFGGGIYLGKNTTLNLQTSIGSSQMSLVMYNSAKQLGAGIFASQANSFYINGTIVASNNSQNSAGGIYSNLTTNEFINLVVAQNYAKTPDMADGIAIYNSPKSVLLECTIADNDEIGIKNDGSGKVSMTNCIVYGHSVSQIWANAEINAIYSDVQNGYPGDGNFDNDPLFVDPDSFYYNLAWNSPCIDAGTDLPTVTNDIIGIFRPQGAAWDVGAYEIFANIMVNKQTLDFGVVLVGDSSNLVLTVENIGSAWVDGAVSNLVLPFSDNSFGNYSLAPGDSTNITFSFSPSVDGDYTNDIVCTGGGNAAVKLIGTTVPEPFLFINFYLLFIIYYRRKFYS